MKHEEALKLGAHPEVELASQIPGIPVPPDAITLKALEARTKRELRRHHVSERDRLVADALCDVTFGLGLTSVKIPKPETLGELVGLPRQHVYTALQRLHEMRIVSVHPKEGVYLYTVNHNSEGWKVMPRVALATILRGMETIRELNHIPEDQSAASKERSTKRGAYRRTECQFIGAWIPDELMVIVDEFVRTEDLDRSKLLRRALEEKCRAVRKAA